MHTKPDMPYVCLYVFLCCYWVEEVRLGRLFGHLTQVVILGFVLWSHFKAINLLVIIDSHLKCSQWTELFDSWVVLPSC